ncbi:MAG TPA: methyltransferase [Candidatus Binataceae bacterium]|jgi:tRNA1Val (adenine37-N6)-methyltransferase|nr:methyltransferase [Candidatus Binataceae bacterium]
MSLCEPSATRDSILGGRLTIIQPARGYRFNLDALLLAYFARPRRGDRVLELGAGCGVVAAAVARLHRPRAVTALELQEEMVELIRRNAELNQLPSLIAVGADLRSPPSAGLARASFDYVVANPPYRALGHGRPSPHVGRYRARAEIDAGLEDFIEAAARYVTDHGRVAFIFSATRAVELIDGLRRRALEPKRLRLVHPYAEAAATAILIEARKQGRAAALIEPPLVVWEKPRRYTAEAARIIGGDWQLNQGLKPSRLNHLGRRP